MKFNKILAAVLAVVTFGFMACNNATDVIKLKEKNITLTVGQTYKLHVEKASGAIAWSCNNADVCHVDADGNVKALATGNAVVSATVGKASASVAVTVGGGVIGGAPDLEAPETGKLKVVIQISPATECHGIALKGTFNGSDWSGADTYLGEDGAATAVTGAIYKFAAIEGYPNWWVVEIPSAADMQFKVCLIYANDGSWEGQGKDVTLHSCNYSTIEPTIAGDGQVSNIGANGGLLYLAIGSWNKSECVVETEKDVTITLIAPKDECAETPVVVGSFCGWNIDNAVAMTPDNSVEGKYTATIKAVASDEFKFAGATSGWDNEPMVFDAENDKYEKISNIKVADKAAFEIDAHDGIWSKCYEDDAAAE